MIKNHK